ncbi:hypothetical protein E1292_02750 [Nonomuraea deserti]|uniref:Uncharacterized protein n=1 Tax=Nonomuraea deserti TaxID=1848322 RepID=A0A4R4W0V5_9ACTN|nr:hypothetical protein E1292_02750 [Nonomuraea deserti]
MRRTPNANHVLSRAPGSARRPHEHDHKYVAPATPTELKRHNPTVSDHDPTHPIRDLKQQAGDMPHTGHGRLTGGRS